MKEMFNYEKDVFQKDEIRSKLYKKWILIRSRCNDKLHPYHEKCIKVTPEWCSRCGYEGYVRFKNYLLDLGYTDRHRVARIDTSKNFEKGNMRVSEHHHSYKHGFSKDPLYYRWIIMMRNYSNKEKYKHLGVSDTFLDFQKFRVYMINNGWSLSNPITIKRINRKRGMFEDNIKFYDKINGVKNG